MAKHKHPRTKGKLSLSRYFKRYKSGDIVAVKKELSIPFPYSIRLQGKTGKIIEKRGASYYLEMKDLGKKKKYIIHPIHLVSIEN